jgi:tetratricopeptide (TPR) repeat protein
MHALRHLLACGAVLLLSACGEAPHPGAIVSNAVAVFVGSDSCRQCHAPQYAGWRGSDHDLAMQVADASTVLGDFDDARFEYFDRTTQFRRDGDAFVVRTGGAGGLVQDFRVAYTFGVRPLQQYLVEFPGGRLQTLPFTWDSRPAAAGGQRWFHIYGEEYIGPDDPLYWTRREQNWNSMCAECHSTDLDVGYDVAGDSFATRWSEIDVGCEACHGPGSRHSAQAVAGRFGADYGFPVDLDDRGRAVWRMNPGTGIAERSELAMRPPQQPEACGRCHARRGVMTPAYEYGRPLADTHLPALLDENLYFADGQIQGEVYVYGSFLQSRMYRAGVSCSDCHDPHSLQLVTAGAPSEVCGRCHLASRFATVQHQHHEPGQVGCVDCHMAARVYMGVDARRDHSFRVPRPDLSVKTGAPNACTACHQDRDPGWAASILHEQWGVGSIDAPHFATALYAARAGHANAALRAAMDDPSTPGIARATALALMRGPLSDADILHVRQGLQDADALVRIGALRAMGGWPPQWRVRLAAALLTDPVRGVRIEAASLLADTAQQLQPPESQAFDDAAREYRAAQMAVASRPAAHSNLGSFAAAHGELEEALQQFETALRMAPEFTPARVNMADALRRRGDEARGEALLREGLRLEPRDATLHHALGLLLARAGRYDVALPELRRAAALQPQNARFAYVYGVALNSTGESQQAVDVLRAAYARAPTDFDIASALVTILRDRGETGRAREIAGELAERYPDNRDAAALLDALGPR